MESNSFTKLQQIYNRIASLHAELAAHHESIKLLEDAFQNNKYIEKTPFAPRIIKYSRIPRSERRFQWTINNLQFQVKLLEKELETLIKYMVNEDRV